METKLVATVLSGNTEDKIGEAIESVINFVDEVLLLDTGISDNTLDVAKKAAKDKLHVVAIGWKNDFAWARNEALSQAIARKATWAITVDTDERIVFDDYKTRDEFVAVIDDTNVGVWGCAARDGTYGKERVFRLPAEGSWEGRTHEAYSGVPYNRAATVPGLTFWETHKNAEEFRNKVERDLKILLEMTEAKPKESRWWYYLGQTYDGLGQNKHAEMAFRQALVDDEWKEQRGWTHYQIAKSLSNREAYHEGRLQAIEGFKDDSRFPELAWMAAWCSFKLEEYEQAINWAAMAASLGNFNGTKAGLSRISFRHLPAWFEAPFDIMRHSYGALSHGEEEAKAEQLFNAAHAMRKELYG